jgi:uncharacterized protein (DUF1778 family)
MAKGRQITIYVRDDILEEIDERADAAGCNRSEYLVRSALAGAPTITRALRRQIAKELGDFAKTALLGGE